MTKLGRDALVHTNHALAEETVALSQQRPPELQASSERRLEHASASLASGKIGFDDLVELTRHPTLCYPPAPPLSMTTCGAVIMRPRTLDFWTCEGPPDANEYEHFSLQERRADTARAGAGAS